ncbi:MAG: ATP-dependent protease LonB [Candidatus Micrarchaeales archaeon]|jgi:Lon-like ATP-dependent protease
MKRFKTTADIKISTKLIDQVVGQDKAVKIVKKAAKQHRNILLIGSPGTGKTMLAQAMAELMPTTDLEDVLVYKNQNDENRPLIKTFKTYPNLDHKNLDSAKPLGDGQGRQIIQKERMKSKVDTSQNRSSVVPITAILIILLLVFAMSSMLQNYQLIVLAAVMLGILIFSSALVFVSGFKRVGMFPGLFESNEPKLIIDNTGMNHAPFVDGTGSRAGALFGDVKHDPLQSGGLGTPPHLRVESGAVHRANKGVLFIDEIADLEPKSQQELLTAMQEKKYSITGQSELSSGAIVRTEPVPSDFLLVAAGNLMDIERMHPALRSRIRGYGYEVYMESTMPDTEENRDTIVKFIAQEINKDKRIPSFSYDACMEIINDAKRRAGRKHRLTLILRDLGGLIRAAGDIAVEKERKEVTKEDVLEALGLAKPIEAQYAEQELEYIKDYRVFGTRGFAIGKVNGLAVIGSSVTATGIVTPIVAEVTPASSRAEGKLIATGKLGKIAREAVKNISAVIKRHMHRDIASYDIHVQFIQTYAGVEGDSASISVAVSVISALEGIPVRQDTAMTGSLSVRGMVLPVGGVTPKVKAAIEAGMKYVVIP